MNNFNWVYLSYFFLHINLLIRMDDIYSLKSMIKFGLRFIYTFNSSRFLSFALICQIKGVSIQESEKGS